MLFKAPPKRLQRQPEITSIRLPESQINIVKMPRLERSKWVTKAVELFLAWETYAKTDWSQSEVGDGNTFLDSVEMGVEYKTRSKLLPPTQLTIPRDTMVKINEAILVVEKHRPNLNNRGIMSGIIRSAIANRIYLGD